MNKNMPGIGLRIESSKETTSDISESPKKSPLRRNISEESLDDISSDVESFEVDPRTVIYPDTD